MSVISCGGMRYQHKWKDTELEKIPCENQENLEKTIHRALDVGINHFETARGYGTSEMQLGRVLPGVPREKIIVQTKVVPEKGPRQFRQDFEQSMAYLGMDYVDLLSLHGINNHEVLDQSLRRGGALDVARQFQREGRARFIGFATHAPTHIILQAIRSGEFDYVNLHWYFVNPLNWPAIMAARDEQDMGVFIISPNDKGGKLFSPPSKLIDLCQPLHPMAFNDLYCLSQERVHTLSCGAATPSDFDIHLQAVRRLDEANDLINPIIIRLGAAMQAEFGAEFAARWHEGLPDFQEVPEEINALEIIRLWLYARSFDLYDWAKMRYNMMEQAGHWFPGKRATNASKLDFSQTFAASPFASRIPSMLAEAHAKLNDKAVVRQSQSED